MKFTKVLFASVIILASASSAFSGPAQTHLQRREKAAAPAPAAPAIVHHEKTTAGMRETMGCGECPRTTRPHAAAAGKAARRLERNTCGGCEGMTAGARC